MTFDKQTIIGQRYGRLEILDYRPSSKAEERKYPQVLCQCECGSEPKWINWSHVKSGRTQSCGCLQRERVIETRREDLVGKKFGRLTVVEYSHTDKNRNACWKCLCECGNETIVSGNNLKTGNTQSCGCYKQERTIETHRKDLSGKKFGRLVVTGYSHTDKNGHAHWKCICDCGNETIVCGRDLKNGHTKSCGCYKQERTIETCREDLAGKKFGRLTVIEYSHTKNNIAYWKCICDCGNETIVRGSNLKDENTKSCGCIGASTMETFFQELLTKEFPSILYAQQWTHEDLKNKINLRVDFCLYINGEPIFVELDGKQHYDTTNRRYSEEQVARDQIKNEFFKERNNYFFRIPYAPNKDRLREYLQAFNTLDLEFLKANCYFYNLPINNY